MQVGGGSALLLLLQWKKFLNASKRKGPSAPRSGTWSTRLSCRKLEHWIRRSNPSAHPGPGPLRGSLPRARVLRRAGHDAGHPRDHVCPRRLVVLVLAVGGQNRPVLPALEGVVSGQQGEALRIGHGSPVRSKHRWVAVESGWLSSAASLSAITERANHGVCSASIAILAAFSDVCCVIYMVYVGNFDASGTGTGGRIRRAMFMCSWRRGKHRRDDGPLHRQCCAQHAGASYQ